MNPYEVLGLERGETDLAVIRRAYAAALRQHRPDEDPEGFRRVRAAYEMVSAWARPEECAPQDDGEDDARAPADAAPLTERRARGGARGRTDPRDEGADPFLPAHPALAEWHEAERIASPAQRHQALKRAAAALASAMRADPRLARAWSELVSREYGGRPAMLAELAGDADLVAELEAGASAVTRAVLAHLAAKADFDRIASLGRRVLESRGTEVHGAAATRLHLALALHLAIPWPVLARKLADRAFAIMPASERRESDADRLDELLVAGREIETWEHEFRYAVARLVMRGPGAAARDRVEAMVLDKARWWKRESVLRGLLLGYAFVADMTPVAAFPERDRDKLGGPSFPVVVFACIVLLSSLRLCSRESHDRTRTRIDRPSIQKAIDDAQRAVEDSRRLREELRRKSEGQPDGGNPADAPTPPRASKLENYRKPDGTIDLERWARDLREERNKPPRR